MRRGCLALSAIALAACSDGGGSESLFDIGPSPTSSTTSAPTSSGACPAPSGPSFPGGARSIGGAPAIGGAFVMGGAPSIGGAPAIGGALSAGGSASLDGSLPYIPPPPEPLDYVAPPSGLPDVVFEMGSSVQPGAESLACMYAVFPRDRGVIAVQSAESHFTPGSHHLLAYRSDLTSIPSGQTGVWSCADGSWVLHDPGSYYQRRQSGRRR